MPFELKILDNIHCPRCNGKAELRIDQHKSDSKIVLVYVVCPICRLNRYSHTTTRKAIKIHSKIKKLKKKSVLSPAATQHLKQLEKMMGNTEE